MRKWLVLLIVMILGIASFLDWQDRSKSKHIVNILNSIPTIEKISAKEVASGKELFQMTKTDPSFSVVVNVFQLPYMELKWSEKKLVKQDPLFVIDYLKDDDVLYKVNIYELKDENVPVLVNRGLPNEQSTYGFMYSPPTNESTYVFRLDEYNQLIGVNEGLKEVLNKILIQ
jgi:hypothetical protein